MKLMMRAISLFSGVGGMDLGFERAGIETVLQCEIDPHARSVLERHWPGVERVEDVRDLRGTHCTDRLERLGSEPRDGLHPGRGTGPSGSHDLLYGGFPCQGASTAGKQAGLADDRTGLFFEFARIASEVLPQWLVIENVTGLLSVNQGRDFAVILNSLDELGYGLAWRVFDSRYFGVPQPRRRVFIVGCLGSGTRAARVLSIPQEGEGNPRTDGASQPDPADTSGHGPHCCRVTRRPRNLTPLECERLMGWPDDHTRWAADGKEIADVHRYRMCGNGVVSNVAQWIGERLVRA